MSTSSSWTVVFEDKIVINRSVKTNNEATSYTIEDDSFWNQAHFANLWAIQFGTTPSTDEVEHKDSTPHTSYDSTIHGNFNEFITSWDAIHLAELQGSWDNNNVDGETAEQKINRIGARPTSFTSPSV